MYPLKPFEIEFPTAQHFDSFWLRLATQEAQDQLMQILLTVNNRALAASREVVSTDKLNVAFRGRSCYIGLKGDQSLRTGMVLEYDNPLASTHPTWIGYVTLNEDGHFDRIYTAQYLDRARSRIIEMEPHTTQQLERMGEQLLRGRPN